MKAYKCLVAVFILVLQTACDESETFDRDPFDPEGELFLPVILEELNVYGTLERLPVGSKESLIALGRLNDDTIVDYTLDVEWRSLDESIAKVTSEGEVVVLGLGIVTIEAYLSSYDRQASTDIEIISVTSENQLQTFECEIGFPQICIITDCNLTCWGR